MPEHKKKVDMVVKLGLGVMITSFALIFGGMFLTRPDRSIPPYSIGAQEGTVVAIHVPSWTSDGEIEGLLRRFQKVGHETRDFGPLKIRPTTPEDPEGYYRRIQIYIFSQDSWTDPDVVHNYLEGSDTSVKKGFEAAVRGLYQLDEFGEEGRIGRVLSGPDTPATAAYSRILFKGPVDSDSQRQMSGDDRPNRESTTVSSQTAHSPSPSSGEREDRDL